MERLPGSLFADYFRIADHSAVGSFNHSQRVYGEYPAELEACFWDDLIDSD
jgi:hypothetical protein